jgi:UDP-N-acetylmuramoyl-tripeptide--D-alanyl-D-alanine ligase
MMSLREAAAAMNGELHGPDARMSGVSTDTRTLRSGDLFFALRGERFDAVRFLDQAYAGGACAAVVARDAVATPQAKALIAVDDARAALGRLAAAWRLRFSPVLIGLTGSNGKTTVKDMIAAVLRSACADSGQVLATRGNLNNDIGVPLTLLELRARHRYAVIEMGMNHAGEIRYLTKLALPDVALVNNAGAAHIGLLGSLEAIAGAKGEIFEGLQATGIAVINADDAFAPYWRGLNEGRTIIEFGLDHPAHVTGSYQGHALHSEIVLKTPQAECAFALPMPGAHNVRNALAAAAVAVALDVPAAVIARALAGFAGSEGRMQRVHAINDATLIDDTYNANPDSMLAAIAVLAQLPGKRVLVLGDMAELGAEAPGAHVRVGEAARAAGIERLFTLGELSRDLCAAFGPGGRHYQRIEDLLAAVGPELDAGTTVLVKGSRSMQMERIVESFAVPASC